MRHALILKEPTGSLCGGGSPFVAGIPIEQYQKIAPVKIEYVDPRDLTFTDYPGNIRIFHDLHKAWEDSIVNSVCKPKWELPLICPPAIDREKFILDGNHRAATSVLHTPKIPVFLVENQEDVLAIRKLVDKGVYWWAHGGMDFENIWEKTEKCAEGLSIYEYLSEIEGKIKTGEYDLEELDWEYGDIPCGSAVYFSKDPTSDNGLKYCLSRAIHQKGLNENSQLAGGFLVNFYSNKDKIKVDNEFYQRLRALASKNPLVKKNSNSHNLDDIIQDTLVLMRPIVRWSN